MHNETQAENASVRTFLRGYFRAMYDRVTRVLGRTDLNASLLITKLNVAIPELNAVIRRVNRFNVVLRLLEPCNKTSLVGSDHFESFVVS